MESNEGSNWNEYLIYKPLQESPDPKKIVFSKGKKGGTYHLYEDCEILNGNFVDFVIPPEIQDLDNKIPESGAVNFFRDWFAGLVWEQIKNKIKNYNNFSERYNSLITTGMYLSRIIDKLDFQINNELIITRYNCGYCFCNCNLRICFVRQTCYLHGFKQLQGV